MQAAAAAELPVAPKAAVPSGTAKKTLRKRKGKGKGM